MPASPRLTTRLAAATLLGALGALAPAVADAQYNDEGCGPFCDVYDYQFFEPVDLDLDCRPIRFHCGWTFSYDKVLWAITGERTTVGDPTVDVISEVIFPGNTNTAETEALTVPTLLINGFVPQSVPGYSIENGIRNAPPRAEFGFGNRYEMGYRGRDGRGFQISVLDGPEVSSEQIFGFAPQTDTQSSPFGFGSVHVNFRTPTDFLFGFRDYTTEQVFLSTDTDIGGDDDDDDGFTAGAGPTQNGPGDDLQADGLIDDILVNGTTFFILDVNGDGMFDLENDAFYVDFGDLHEFNIRFNQLGVRNSSRVDGVELMRTVILSNRHFMQKHQNQHLEIGYGARLLRFEDQFLIDGVSDVLGRTFIDTQAENQIVGPQVRVKWQIQKAKWNLAVDGRCMLGYNIGDLSQTYGIGEDLAPGALNRPLIAQPTFGSSGKQEETFSPVVEFRADLKYQVTRSISLNLGYNAMFIDNISRSSQLVDYVLPDPGILQGGKQDAFVNGVNFGVEFWH
ncbi:MAG: BBP7 family outer membrane beta-barrel protein [Planctomycetota bacterium]